MTNTVKIEIPVEKLREAGWVPADPEPEFEQPCDDPRKSKLYCGYTEEQWRHIMERGYLCEIVSRTGSVSEGVWAVNEKEMDNVRAGHYRPAQRRGILCPHFGGPKPEWVRDDDMIAMRKYAIGLGVLTDVETLASDINWGYIREFLVMPRKVVR
jgi:hypothetical protein